MSLYKDASLVMIPSAVKDGKLYSIRPTPEYGEEEVTNGDFATDSDWSKGNGATISGGKANIIGDGSTYVSITQNSVFTTGKKYRVSVDVVINSGLGLKFQDGATNENIGFATSSGTYVFDFTAGSNTSLVVGRRTGGTAFNSSVDNISVKEISNDGDFTFSRGSNLAATRVDVNGLIEKGRENLLLQSNQFDTTWLRSGTSITGGQSGYDGSSDAWLLSATNAYANVYQTISNTGVLTFSCYAKAGTSDWMMLRLNGSSNNLVYFDVANGVLGTIVSSNYIDSNIEALANGWFRLSITINQTSYSGSNIYVAAADNDLITTNETIYIQDAQLEQGLVATDYIETGASTAQAGILEDLPRLDYSGSCPSLLLEPQRTNVLAYSEYFESSVYDLSANVTRTLSSTLSPEGKLNAYQITPNTTNTNHQFRAPNLGGFTSGAVVSSSFFAKANGYKYISVVGGFGSSSTPAVVFDLEQGVIDSGGDNGDIESYGNGWYRCTARITLGGTALYCVGTILNDDKLGSFAGDGVKGIEAYGWQIEEGSYPTSYIPTYGSAVTRSSDSCLATSVSDLIGQEQGTIYWEGSVPTADQNSNICQFNNDTNSSVVLEKRSNGKIRARIWNSGSAIVGIQSSSYGDENLKIAFAYASGDIALYINGTQIATDTTAFSFTQSLSAFQLGVGILFFAYPQTSKAKQSLLFKTRLTNAELAALTA